MNKKSNILDFTEFQTDYRNLQNECRKKKEFIDVQLQIGEKLFDAHRNVLSLYSPVLKAMFSDQWSTTKICPISEEYVDVEIMEDLMDFFYTGKIELTPDNVHPICMAAHFLQIPKLLEKSVDYLCQFITIENVLTLFQFSISSHLKLLRYFCLQTVKENYETVFQNSLILEFSFKDFNELIIELKEKWCESRLREHTFHCIVRWTEKNSSERLEHLPILLKNIPLKELSFDFLTETVFPHPLVNASISCVETVSTTIDNYWTYPRPQKKQNLIVVGKPDEGNDEQFMNCYDSQTGIWRKIAMPFLRSFPSVTVVNEQDIVVCGGYDPMQSMKETKSVQMFEWSTQTWINLPGMPVALNGSSVAHNGHLYVANGRGSKIDVPNRSKKVLCFSFETKQWKFIGDMNQVNCVAQLIAYKNHIYALDISKSIVEKYDPARDEWTIVSEIIGDTEGMVAALHQNKIYVCAMFDFKVYDPETNVWTALREPPPVNKPSLVSLNGKLLAVGGFHRADRKYTNIIYEFDHSTQIWKEFGKTNSFNGYNSAVVGDFF